MRLDNVELNQPFASIIINIIIITGGQITAKGGNGFRED